MLVFNNQQRSGYEEIVSYSPRYYRSIKEMDAVFRLAGWIIDLMAQDMEDMVAFQFLEHMNDHVLSRYEIFLGITKDADKTLDERKNYVNAVLLGSGRISADRIASIVNQFAGCVCEDVALTEDLLCISITVDKSINLKTRESIYDLIKMKLPAHISVDIAFDNVVSLEMYFGATIEQVDILEIKQR